jgi:hypothetical protein
VSPTVFDRWVVPPPGSVLTVYGGPGDPYVRIIVTSRLEGETLMVEHVVIGRAYAESVTVPICVYAR